ncbi:MAG: substrate-binding domain-containing protein [Gaiellaceae bacterium]
MSRIRWRGRLGLTLGVVVAAGLATTAWAASPPPVLSTGPHGEKAAPASNIVLTQADIAKVKAMHATAAIALHYGGNDWSTAQVAGQKHEFAALGIKVIAVTDANFVAATQVAQVNTLITRKPNIIVSIPTDPVATASAYKAAAKAGIKLVFMDNVPSGMKAGVDYMSDVSADNYGNGVVSAQLLAKALKGKGTIALIFHEADFFVTHERYLGFKNTIKKYPGIKIVAEQGVPGPNFSAQAETAASAILTRYPKLTAMWGVWDVPATGIVSAAKAAGRNDLVVATEDLGLDDAVPMAQGQNICCVGAQRPYDQGVTEAKIAALGLLGKKAPPYVALPALGVTRANVLQAWRTIYHVAPPAQLVKAAKAHK